MLECIWRSNMHRNKDIIHSISDYADFSTRHANYSLEFISIKLQHKIELNKRRIKDGRVSDNS